MGSQQRSSGGKYADNLAAEWSYRKIPDRVVPLDPEHHAGSRQSVAGWVRQFRLQLRGREWLSGNRCATERRSIHDDRRSGQARGWRSDSNPAPGGVWGTGRRIEHEDGSLFHHKRLLGGFRYGGYFRR